MKASVARYRSWSHHILGLPALQSHSNLARILLEMFLATYRKHKEGFTFIWQWLPSYAALSTGRPAGLIFLSFEPLGSAPSTTGSSIMTATIVPPMCHWLYTEECGHTLLTRQRREMLQQLHNPTGPGVASRQIRASYDLISGTS